MNVWLHFAACAGVILFAGTQLSRHGDVIAAKTGLGRSWVGLVLLATITSLPELITGVSAVTFNDLPDMATSGVLGSCMFNVVVIAGLDFLSKGKPVSRLVHQGHMLSAGFGIVLVGCAAIDILVSKYLPPITFLNSSDPISLFYVAIYFVAMRLIFSYEKQRVSEFVEEVGEATSAGESLRRSVVIFALNALLIVVAACMLPELADQIAKLTGWGDSFIGASFIAITTSLPEITVSVAAARMGAFDMAVANLLGSNLFNVFILAIIDFSYVKGPLLQSVSQINAVTALSAMIAMGIVVIGLTYRSEKKYLRLAGDAIAISFVYVMSNVFLFVAK